MRPPVLFLLGLLLASLVACGGQESEPTPIPPTPTPTPQQLLDNAVRAWNETASFHFSLTLTARTIALDESGVLSFDEAEGDVVAPDRVQAETLIQTPFGSTTVAYIAIADEQWLTNPLSGQWEAAPAGLATDVSGLFHPEGGIGALLADMQALERSPDEEVDGVPTVRLRGTLPGTLLSDFATDLPETVNVELWAGVADSRIRKLVITEPTEEGPTPTWTFLFSQFDAAPAIEPPL